VSSASPRERIVLLSALAFVAFVAVVAMVWAFRPVPPAPETRLDITTPPTADSASLAISPDGQKIVCVATSEGQSKLWLRLLDSTSGRALAGTDGASFPFWSPDNQSVGFFADGKLKRVDVDRGSVQILADAPDGRGGAWNRAQIAGFGPLMVYPAGGASPTLICGSCAPPQGTDIVPSPLSWTPDGRFLYLTFAGSTYAIPLQPGQMLPPIPASGFQSKEAVAALPGARLVSEESVFPGPNPSVYTFVKASRQGNIYRVPVP